jgi:hypothetical protein
MSILKTLLTITTIILTNDLYAYEKYTDKWMAGIIVGEIAYYGGNCEGVSPIKHRKLQTKVIEDAFGGDRENVFAKSIEVISSSEFELGMNLAHTQGCLKTKKKLDSIVDNAGITGKEPPKYLPPEAEDKAFQLLYDFFNKKGLWD